MKKLLQFNWLQILLGLFFIGFLGYSLDSKIEQTFLVNQPFTNIDVVYDPITDESLENYIARDQQQREKFLFAPNAPGEMRLRLVALESQKTTLVIEPNFSSSSCGSEDSNKTNLHIYNQSAIDQTLTLTTGQRREIIFDFFKGDTLEVEVTEADNGRCGKAELSFYKKNRADKYHFGFLTFWAVLLCAFYVLTISPWAAVFGAAYNTVLVFANATIGVATLDGLIATTVISLGFCGVLIMIASLPIFRWFRTLLNSIFALIAFFIPVTFIAYNDTFGSAAGQDEVHAILQSNPRQSLEFLLEYWRWQYSFYLFFSLLLIFTAGYFICSKPQKKLRSFLLGSVLLLVCLMNTLNLRDRTPILLKIDSAITTYFHEFEMFRELRDERLARLENIGATTNAKNQTLVVILGESASKHHMSSYGYARETTPYVDSLIGDGQMIRFDAAYSNHILSNQTIARVLTNASNYNGSNWIHSPSVINIAHTAGIETAWVSNKPMYGAFDSHMSVIGTEAENVTYINTRVGIRKLPNEHDAKMLPLVKEAIAERNNNRMVFMHLQGSHTHYCQRTPGEFKTFNEVPQKHIFGTLTEEILKRYQSINCYDDSIRYSDEIINDVIRYLAADSTPSAMLYFSDHGEDAVFQRGHNPALFSFQMSDIPMFFWADEEWRAQNPLKWQSMIENKEKMFTNDHAFEFISGLNGIESELLDHKNNLASATYSEVEAPSTLHGARRLDVTGNTNFWQQQNIARLSNQDGFDKLVARASNTINKIGFMQGSGITSVEVDLYFQNGEYRVGEDDHSSANLDLFLSDLDLSYIERIWFNLRTLEEGAVDEAVLRLKILDEKYKFKEKAALLLKAKDLQTIDFTISGLTTIYNIAQELAVDDLGSGILVENIVSTASSSQVNGIALDPIQYENLKENLDSLIEDFELSVHLRLPEPKTLSEQGIFDELIGPGFLLDKNIESISVQTWSLYQ